MCRTRARRPGGHRAAHRQVRAAVLAAVRLARPASAARPEPRGFASASFAAEPGGGREHLLGLGEADGHVAPVRGVRANDWANRCDVGDVDAHTDDHGLSLRTSPCEWRDPVADTPSGPPGRALGRSGIRSCPAPAGWRGSTVRPGCPGAPHQPQSWPARDPATPRWRHDRGRVVDVVVDAGEPGGGSARGYRPNWSSPAPACREATCGPSGARTGRTSRRPGVGRPGRADRPERGHEVVAAVAAR